MTKQEPGGCGLLIFVALVAFVMGRCTASPEPQLQQAPQPFSGFEAAPAYSDESAPDAVAPPPLPAPLPAPVAQPNRFYGGNGGSRSGSSNSYGDSGASYAAGDDDAGSVYFANCSAARAAGAAPVRAGDPGYARRLDRDGDGIGCE